MFALADRVLNGLTRALTASLGLAAAVMALCIAWQVLMRYVFGRAPSWTEEVAMLAFAWAILGGMALGVRQGFHVRLDLLIKHTPEPLRFVMERIIDLATAGFGLFVVWAGWRYVDMTRGSVSAAIGYPVEWLHFMAPAAGALITIFALARLGPSGRAAELVNEGFEGQQ